MNYINCTQNSKLLLYNNNIVEFIYLLKLLLNLPETMIERTNY